MKVEQFVMAYGVEQDRLRAFLPEGFTSLRPVLRINGEIRSGKNETVYLELNTAVAYGNNRGWLNVGRWDSRYTAISYERNGKEVTFQTPFLKITFAPVGVVGGCPAERDNDGCFFINDFVVFRSAEQIDGNKEFCDCKFAWNFFWGDAHGISTGETLQAVYTEPKGQYEKQKFSPKNAAKIPCEQVLGAYVVQFERASL